jgi:hypothetical protein
MLMCQPDVGTNLMFALELITLSFLCTMGEHKVRPYTFKINVKLIFREFLKKFNWNMKDAEIKLCQEKSLTQIAP